MTFGFSLRRMSLTGAGKKDAQLTFRRGLNVIAGPSDTGKSFVLQCIDFALGAGTPPKDIPEAEGYSRIVLELESNDDQRVYSLERGLRGGDVLCKTDGLPDRFLGAEHEAGNKDTVSQFLLDLSGLESKKVRRDGLGRTRALSFRDIAPLTLVDEQAVIREESPILSGQFLLDTVEKGVFRILLTGDDDSSIVAKEDPKIVKGKDAGKVELLVGLLAGTREKLNRLGQFETLTDERDRLSRIEKTLQVAIAERTAAQASIEPYQAARNSALNALRAIESKLAVSSELLVRFDLLQEQYESDLKRLEAISEASLRLDQLNEERCPVRGALAEHHDASHQEERPASADVARACSAETVKTLQLLSDLRVTQIATTTEVEQFSQARDEARRELDAVSAELKSVMVQRVDTATRSVDELRLRAEISRKAVEYLERIHELDEMLSSASKSRRQPKTKFPAAALSAAQADAFSREVEALLRAWQYLSDERVSFSEKDQDVIISGRTRRSHGKGVRAIIRAAFNLALLRLCLMEKRPFPNFVVIDSPLIVYKEPDVGESTFPSDVKKNFWISVKESFVDAQVIIIENSDQLPADSTLNGVQVELFTGNDQGRRGFIPSNLK